MKLATLLLLACALFVACQPTETPETIMRSREDYCRTPSPRGVCSASFAFGFSGSAGGGGGGGGALPDGAIVNAAGNAILNAGGANVVRGGAPIQVGVVYVGASNTGGKFAYPTTIPSPPGNVQYVEYSTLNSNSGIVGALAPRPTTNVFGPSFHCGLDLSAVFTTVTIGQAETDSVQVVNWLPGGIDIYTSQLLPACAAVKTRSPSVPIFFAFDNAGLDAEMQVSSPTISAIETSYRTHIAQIRAQFPIPVHIVLSQTNIAYRTTIAFSTARFDQCVALLQSLAADPTLAPIGLRVDDDLAISANHYTAASQITRGQRDAAYVIANYPGL